MCGIVGAIEHSHTAASSWEDTRRALIHAGQRLAHGAGSVAQPPLVPSAVAANFPVTVPAGHVPDEF
jgi:hypothetical protein